MAMSINDMGTLIEQKFRMKLEGPLDEVAKAIELAQNAFNIEFTECAIIFLMLPFLEENSGHASYDNLDLRSSLFVVMGVLYPIVAKESSERKVLVHHLLTAVECRIKPWC
jgi:hypothetical protein